MILPRPRTFETSCRGFCNEVELVRKLDFINQTRAQRPGLSAAMAAEARLELHLASEGLFMRLFRHWERFLENSFLLAATSQPSASGRRAHSYIRPRSKSHAYEITMGSRDVISWSKPAAVLERINLLLRDGYPMSEHVEAVRSDLTSMERIRNRIAHESDESQIQYLKVVRCHFMVLPTRFVSPGRLLNLMARGTHVHYLEHYCQVLEATATLIRDG